MKRWYRDYPGVHNAMRNRLLVYNKTLDFTEEQQRLGKLFVIQPKPDPKASRVTRNKDKLYALYEPGYLETSNHFSELVD